MPNTTVDTLPEGWERLAAPSGRGQLYVYRCFASRHLPPRDLYVWVPDGVAKDQPLPVLYMQDGQNLFDARLVPFGVAWEADASVSRPRGRRTHRADHRRGRGLHRGSLRRICT